MSKLSYTLKTFRLLDLSWQAAAYDEKTGAQLAICHAATRDEAIYFLYRALRSDLQDYASEIALREVDQYGNGCPLPEECGSTQPTKYIEESIGHVPTKEIPLEAIAEKCSRPAPISQRINSYCCVLNLFKHEDELVGIIMSEGLPVGMVRAKSAEEVEMIVRSNIAAIHEIRNLVKWRQLDTRHLKIDLIEAG